MVELKHKEITEKIIGAAFEVHKFLGNACLPARQGFQEVIYQRALAWEMSQVDLTFNREIEQEIYYKELREPIGTRRADFVVEDKLLVELKALKELEDVHMAQVLNYLKAYSLEVGLLINFGSKSLTFKRMVYNMKSVKSENPCLAGRQACKSVVQTSCYMVKAHGGEIKAVSIEGKGSEFILQIPIA